MSEETDEGTATACTCGYELVISFWFLPHTQSRCRATCDPELQWTYHQLQLGSRSHDTWCWRVQCNLRETNRSEWQLTDTPVETSDSPQCVCRTFLTVRLSVLHVEEAVSKRFAAGCADEAGGVPRLPQGMHHLLQHATCQTRWVCVTVCTEL